MFKKPNFSKLKPKIRPLLSKIYSLKHSLHHLKPTPYSLKPKTYTLFIIVLGVIALFLILFFVAFKPAKQSIKISKKLSGKPVVGKIVPLAPGKQVYTIRTDKPKNPQIIQVELDPLDVKIGEEQILTVKVKHSDKESITDKNSVKAVYYTDNGSSTVKLKLRRADGPPLVTTLEGVWVPKDTHNYIYQAAIKAISAKGQFLTTLSFR